MKHSVYLTLKLINFLWQHNRCKLLRFAWQKFQKVYSRWTSELENQLRCSKKHRRSRFIISWRRLGESVEIYQTFLLAAALTPVVKVCSMNSINHSASKRSSARNLKRFFLHAETNRAKRFPIPSQDQIFEIVANHGDLLSDERKTNRFESWKRNEICLINI